MRYITLAALLLLLLPATATAAGDSRVLVDLPKPMQEHMMANMRDHLLALEEVLAALAAGKVRQAGEIAERRIGMSSLEMHGAAHMGPHMPEGMRQAGAALHSASSRFSRAADEAEIEHTYEAQQKVFAALRDVTAGCNACHAGYRIR